MNTLKTIIPLYITKYNFKLTIKTSILVLFILMNILLFGIFLFSFFLLYIKQFTVCYIFNFKVFSLVVSIFLAWLDLLILSPIIILPNLLILIIIDSIIGFTNYIKFNKHKLKLIFKSKEQY